MSKVVRSIQTPLPAAIPDADPLFQRVSVILDRAQAAVARTIDTQMVLAYWHIGREIVEAIQGGEERAEYGQQVLKGLSTQLSQRYGRGYSVTTLRYIRLFYQAFAGRDPIPVGPGHAWLLQGLPGAGLGRATDSGLFGWGVR